MCANAILNNLHKQEPPGAANAFLFSVITNLLLSLSAPKAVLRFLQTMQIQAENDNDTKGITISGLF